MTLDVYNTLSIPLYPVLPNTANVFININLWNILNYSWHWCRVLPQQNCNRLDRFISAFRLPIELRTKFGLLLADSSVRWKSYWNHFSRFCGKQCNLCFLMSKLISSRMISSIVLIYNSFLLSSRWTVIRYASISCSSFFLLLDIKTKKPLSRNNATMYFK